MRKTYSGGCHCRAVRYEAKLDLAEGTFRCNCTICSKLRNWIVRLPGKDFRYVLGADVVTSYDPKGQGVAGFHFCPICGVRIGTAVDHPSLGKRFNLSVPSLEDVPVEELLAAPVRWIDQLNDRGMEEPDEVRHL